MMKRALGVVTVSVSVLLQAALFAETKPVFPKEIPAGVSADVRKHIHMIAKGRPLDQHKAMRMVARMGDKAIPAGPWLAAAMSLGSFADQHGYGKQQIHLGSDAGWALSLIFKDKPKEMLALYNSPGIQNKPKLRSLMYVCPSPETDKLFATCFTDQSKGVMSTIETDAIQRVCHDAKMFRKWRTTLMPLLKDKECTQKVAIINALHQDDTLPKEECLDILVETLKVYDRERDLRVACLKWLAKEKDPRGLAAMPKELFQSKSKYDAARVAVYAFDYGRTGYDVIVKAISQEGNDDTVQHILRHREFRKKVSEVADSGIIKALFDLALSASPCNRAAGEVLSVFQKEVKGGREGNSELFAELDKAYLEKLEKQLLNGKQTAQGIVGVEHIVSVWSCDSPRVIEILMKALNGTDPAACAGAAIVLGRKQHKEAFPIVIKRLNDPKDEIRLGCVKALEQYGDKAAIDPLYVRLGDWNSKVETATRSALLKLGVTAIDYSRVKKLKPPKLDVNSGDAATVLEALLAKSTSSRDRNNAAVRLGELSVSDPDVFVKLVRAVDEKHRPEIAKLLYRNAGKENSDILIGFINDTKDDAVRDTLINQSRFMKAPSAELAAGITTIALTSANQKNRQTACSAVKAYQENKESAAVCEATFCDVLEKGTMVSKRDAVKLFGSPRTPRMGLALAGLLKDEDGFVRQDAERALGKLLAKDTKDDKTVPRNLTQQEHDTVCAAIVKVFQADLRSKDMKLALVALSPMQRLDISDPGLCKLLLYQFFKNKDRRVQGVAIDMLKKQGPVLGEHARLIAKAMTKADTNQLLTIGVILSTCGGEQCSEVLGNVATTHKETQVRQSYARYLGNVKPPDKAGVAALSTLVSREKNKNVQFAALCSLLNAYKVAKDNQEVASKCVAAIGSRLSRGESQEQSTILNSLSVTKDVDKRLVAAVKRLSRDRDKNLAAQAKRTYERIK